MSTTGSFVRFSPIVEVFTIPLVKLHDVPPFPDYIDEPYYERRSNIDPNVLCIMPRHSTEAPMLRFFNVIQRLLIEHIQIAERRNPGCYLDPVLEYVNIIKNIAHGANHIYPNSRIDTLWRLLPEEKRHAACDTASSILACPSMDYVEYLASTFARYVNNARISIDYRNLFKRISEEWLLEKMFALSNDTITGILSDELRDKFSTYVFSYYRIVETCLSVIDNAKATAFALNRLVYVLFTTIYDEPCSVSKTVRDIARETFGYVQNIRVKCAAITFVFTLLNDNRPIAVDGVVSQGDRHFLFNDLYALIDS